MPEASTADARAATDTLVALAETDTPPDTGIHRLAADVGRALAAYRGPLALTGEASPTGAAVAAGALDGLVDLAAGIPTGVASPRSRHRLLVLLTYRPAQITDPRPAQWICNYAVDLALPLLRRWHDDRTRITLVPTGAAATLGAYWTQLRGTPRCLR